MKTLSNYKPFNLFDELFETNPPIPKSRKTLSDIELWINKHTQSNSYCISDHSENEVLYRFTLPGVTASNLSVKYHPDEDVIKIQGKVKYECCINESDNDLENNIIRHTIKLNRKYDPTEPLTTLLKDGILYLKFGTKQTSQVKEYNISLN